MSLHAPAVSRHLRSAHGIITLPDRRREGYRVTGSSATGTVTVHVMFDHEGAQERKTNDLAEALIEDGYYVRVNASAGLITLTGKASA